MQEFKQVMKKPAKNAGSSLSADKKLPVRLKRTGKFSPSLIVPAFSIKTSREKNRDSYQAPRLSSSSKTLRKGWVNPSNEKTSLNPETYKKNNSWRVSAKIAVVALVGLLSAFAPSLWTAVQPAPAKATDVFVASAWGDGLIDVWWPTMNASVTGIQPLKVLLKNQPVDNYKMYWQVDGGQLNEMPTSNDGYPHKQYDVDLGGWNWKGSGPYTISFVAKDNSGNFLAQQNVTIYIGGQPSQTSTQPAPAPAPAPATPTNTATPSPTATTPQAPAQTTTTVTQKPLDVWWPVNAATLTAPTPFKALLQNSAISDYKMFWQMDGGALNEMANSYQDYPHKESLVDVSKFSNGNHSVNFIAQNSAGALLGKSTMNVNVQNPVFTTASNNVTTTKLKPATGGQTQTPPAPTSSTGNPFTGARLWVNPYSDPANWANSHRSYDPTNAALMDKVASGAEVQWYGGWNSDVQKDVNNNVTNITNAGALPVMVAYNIPNRDCGGYSAGGVNSPDGYKAWIRAMAAGIGSRKAVVILEPDALTLTSCLSSTDLQTRYSLIKDALSVFKANGNTAVYIDAGHPGWIAASDMASRLKQAGVDQADGFALNIANFYTTSDNLNYGKSVSDQIGGKHFVVDTGRNGSGPTADYQWCNPSGRSLGQKPTTSTGNVLADAYLWVKGPGGSDGNCNGGPNAGVFWADYALGLAGRTSW